MMFNVLIFHDDVVVLKESARAALESIQYIVLVGCLQRIIQTADNIVSAGCLSAGQDNTYDLLLTSLTQMSAIPCLSIPGSFGLYSYLAF